MGDSALEAVENPSSGVAREREKWTMRRFGDKAKGTQPRKSHGLREKDVSGRVNINNAAIPHFKMRQRFLIFLIFLIGLLSELKAQSIHGLWKEVYWGPMTSYFQFDTLSSTFKYYYHDDTHGSFGKGNFKIKGNEILMNYDSVVCNKPIIEILDDDLMNNSTSIAFFHYWGFPKRIDIISKGETIYTNWTSSSDSIFEDYSFIRIPQKLDTIDIKIYDSHGFKDILITEFSVRLYQKPFCNISYFPCDAWYSYHSPGIKKLKIRWKGSDFFDIKGKYKSEFKKIK